jgi:hypothetical protein
MTSETAASGTRVTVALPPRDHAALARRAEREGTTVDDLILRAVAEWLTWRSSPTAG